MTFARTRRLMAMGFMALGALVLAASAMAADSGPVVWQDDFEAYPAMSSPTSGGWVIRYDGLGTEYQYVDTLQAATGSKCLHLVGSSCWSCNTYHELPGLCDSCEVSSESRVRVESLVGGDCSPIMARISFENPSVGSWGTEYAGVSFRNDGWIYADMSDSGPTALVPYQVNTWYSVMVVASFRTRTYDVYIDGVQFAEAFPINAGGYATGIEICAGHGSPGPVVWYDDILVTYGTTKDIVPARTQTWGWLKALYR